MTQFLASDVKSLEASCSQRTQLGLTPVVSLALQATLFAVQMALRHYWDRINAAAALIQQRWRHALMVRAIMNPQGGLNLPFGGGARSSSLITPTGGLANGLKQLPQIHTNFNGGGDYTSSATTPRESAVSVGPGFGPLQRMIENRFLAQTRMMQRMQAALVGVQGELTQLREAAGVPPPAESAAAVRERTARMLGRTQSQGLPASADGSGSASGGGGPRPSAGSLVLGASPLAADAESAGPFSLAEQEARSSSTGALAPARSL